MKVVGGDLSGPSNPNDTALVFLEQEGGRLRYLGSRLGADDRKIFAVVSELAKTDAVVVGLDAPLSYNIGGGDRPADLRLRRAVVEIGMPPGSVMAPTMTRMAYLTLRGIAVSRCLDTIDPERVRIVEVHPSASLALRGAPLDDVISFKRNTGSQASLLGWLEEQGLKGVSQILQPTDHYVAACAGALAAWKWSSNKAVWIEHASLPFHPYDFAC